LNIQTKQLLYKREEDGEMSDKVELKDGLYYPPDQFSAKAHVSNLDEYKAMYERSISDPEGFWAEQAGEFHWEQPWGKVLEYNYARSGGPISIKWFLGGKTNISYNCLDRHLDARGDQPALIWESNTPGEDKVLTYRQLHAEVCKFANVLKNFGIKKGDRVTIYLPMVLELSIAMLACARIGAIHSVVFGGFSAESLKDRIVDSECSMLITADGTFRGGKAVTLKQIADEALLGSADEGVEVPNVVVVERVGAAGGIDCNMVEGRDQYWHNLMQNASADCEPVWLDAEDPLFILYTSGSTGKPKGVLHTTGGYMVYTSLTHKYVFDYHDGDVYWCTADIGWITGHSYILYGPLLNGAQSLMFEGCPPIRTRAVFGTAWTSGRSTSSTPLQPPSARSWPRATALSKNIAASPCAFWAPWVSRSTPRPGGGTTRWSATAAARLWTPGGRPKPAVF
jgi:acetyl-CoA synthetase